jgi:hypothetical protein
MPCRALVGVGVVAWHRARVREADAVRQGLTLVHFSLQRKRFLWDRGSHSGSQGLFKGCSGDVRGYSVCISCQKRLRLSLEVDECKPLPSAAGRRGQSAAVNSGGMMLPFANSFQKLLEGLL